MLEAHTTSPLIDDRFRQYVRILACERDRRRSGEAPVSRWTRYKNDASGFFRDVLSYHLWSKQREICRALVDHDKVAVKSCHESGKSFIAGGLVGWWIAVHPPKTAMVVTTAPSFPQVRAILWKEINRVHARGKLPGYTNMTEWLIDKELVAFGRKPNDVDMTAFQGIHAEHLLVVLDEACGVPEPLWVAADSLVANEGGKMLAIGNPDDPNTEFGRICKPGSGWHVITISAYDTPNLTGELVPPLLNRMLVSRNWVEEKRRIWGETNPYYVSKVLGEFPETSEDTLLEPRWVAAAVARELTPSADEPNELGVDVARFGRNESVIYHRHGPRARLVEVMRKRDTMHVADRVVAAVRETGARVVKIDDPGVGGGVVDRVQQIIREETLAGVTPLKGVRVIGVTVGGSAIDRPRDKAQKRSAKERYVNLKAQLTWELRERFREGDIDLGDDLDTQAQACQIRYDMDNRSRMKIESKEELEERLARLGGATGESGSPDRWDALVLAFAEVDQAPPVVFTAEMVGALTRLGQMRRF